MANNLSTATNTNVFASMMLQLHTQSVQQESMQKELDTIKYKLEQASKTLMQKDLLIGSLEVDLEHMIDQLVKIQHSSRESNSRKQWLARPLPGLNQEVANRATA